MIPKSVQLFSVCAKVAFITSFFNINSLIIKNNRTQTESLYDLRQVYEKDIFNVGGAEGEGLYRFLLPDPTCSLVEREPATERLVRFLALDGCSVCPIGQRFVTVG